MSSAASVAQQLAVRFLGQGNYAFSNRLNSTTLARVLPVTTTTGFPAFFEEAGLEGLVVQSVGYEEGTDDPIVHIYVTAGSVRAFNSLPEVDDGVRIQVNRMGKLMVRPEQATGATHQGKVYLKGDRIACGSSCAPSGESYSGTFGALAKKKNSKITYVLSNNHVLAACNHIPVGMPILAPSSADGRPGGKAPGEIARHEEIAELRSGEPTLVQPCREDIALARVTNPDNVSSWQGDDEHGYDTPRTVIAPAAGMNVKKFGRTTGFTLGTIEAFINTPTPIPYKSRFFTATVWFRDVWTIRANPGTAFALPGDSGSLVVMEDGSASVGIIFAASPKGEYGWMIPLVHAASLFGGLTLVHEHGV